jgi:hypothetical protein
MKSLPSPRLSGMTPNFPGGSVLDHAKREKLIYCRWRSQSGNRMRLLIELFL